MRAADIYASYTFAQKCKYPPIRAMRIYIYISLAAHLWALGVSGGIFNLPSALLRFSALGFLGLGLLGPGALCFFGHWAREPCVLRVLRLGVAEPRGGSRDLGISGS